MDSVVLLQQIAEARPAFRSLPPVEIFTERFSGDGEDIRVEQTEPPQMQHDFRNAAGKKDAHGRMVNRSVRQYADESRDATVYRDPVFDGRVTQSGGARDCGGAQEKIWETTKRRVNHHRSL